jgi:flagellar basal-body rod protein FlgB
MSEFMGGVFSSGGLAGLEDVLRFSEARHRYLAENVANVDTPGYVRKDLPVEDFDNALRDAVKRSKKSSGERMRLDLEPFFRPERTDTSGLGILRPLGSDSKAGVLRHDGNNVDIEREMAQLNKNFGRLKRTVSLMKKLLSQISNAMSERPR